MWILQDTLLQDILCFLLCITGHEERMWYIASNTFSRVQTFLNEQQKHEKLMASEVK